jgi:acetyl-CoA carboxylase beta subunit
MEWGSFITGGITILFTYLLITTNNEEEVEVLEEGPDDTDQDLIVNDFTGRHVKTYCQTCRKIKSHKEIQKDLYECTKCKRQFDLRRAS